MLQFSNPPTSAAAVWVQAGRESSHQARDKN